MWLVYCLWIAPIFVEVCKFGNGTMTKGVESVMWSVPLRGRAGRGVVCVHVHLCVYRREVHV